MVRILPLVLLPMLAGCGDSAAPPPPTMRDPAIAAALTEPLLSDPDLVGSSRSVTALTGGGPASGAVPWLRPDADEADRARAEARGLLGGSIASAPTAMVGPSRSPLADAVTAAGVAEALPFARRCAASLDYSFAWAARLPDALPVYPRAAAQEAGGSDQAGCRLRVVNFQTPVAVSDVIDFYFAAATQAGLAPRHSRAGGDAVISGGAGSLVFAVYARPLAGDATGAQTEVDLITLG